MRERRVAIGGSGRIDQTQKFIGQPVLLPVETLYNQAQFDVVINVRIQ